MSRANIFARVGYKVTLLFQRMYFSEEEAKKAIERLIVDNHELERLEALLVSFNIFKAVGMVRQEIRHSHFLAFLLNPNETHRLEDIFLKRLLMRILISASNPQVSPVEIDIANLKNTEVHREWKNIDVLIHSPSNKFICIIENKIDSSEHSNQLQRYKETVLKEFPSYKFILVYLSPDGDPPSDEAWISYSYTEIAELIDNICQKYQTTIGSDIYILMNHYSSLIRRHLVSDSEIAELCRKIYNQHKQALDLIYEHRPDLQSELAEFLRGLVTKDSASHSLVLNDRSKVYIRFAPKEWDQQPFQTTARDWTRTKRVLLFEFVNKPDELFLWLLLGPGNDEIVRQNLYQTAETHQSVLSGLSSELHSKWTCLFKESIFDANDYQDPDIQSLKQRIATVWQNFLLQKLPDIRQLFVEQSSPKKQADDVI